MIHRIAHWLKMNGCRLESEPDGLYLVCVVCGEREFFTKYRFSGASENDKAPAATEETHP